MLSAAYLGVMRKKSRAMKRILLACLWLVTAQGLFAEGFPQEVIERHTHEATHHPISIDLKPLEPGGMVRVMYLGRPVWVYRRTPEEIAQLNTVDNELADPASENWHESIKSGFFSSSAYVWSQLLLATERNIESSNTRSISTEYFVFGGWAPYSGCHLTLLAKPKSGRDEVSFHDPCVGNDYDPAGRVFKGKMIGGQLGKPAKFNLFVPPHRFPSANTVEIGLPKGASLPELPADFFPTYEGVSVQQALQLAARYNQRNMVLLAIAQGADVTLNFPGHNPLAAAVIGSDIQIVQLMLELGAQPTSSAREAASMLEREDVLELLNKHETHNK